MEKPKTEELRSERNKFIFLRYRKILCLLLVISTTGCNKKNDTFSEDDIETQDLFIKLLDVTHNKVNKTLLIDSIKTHKLPPADQVIRSNESGGYVDVLIKLSEEERRLSFYQDVMQFYSVSSGECFLPSIDHKFSFEDFMYNIKPCLGNIYSAIEPILSSKFSKDYKVDNHLFGEVNKVLQFHGIEMGMVNFYNDQFYFIFFDKKNKSKVYAIFDSLGIEIGDENTLFRGFKR
ncbi:hypothetical protein [Aquimarina sp. 2304DJ70-9]|uniref:hypothetical protein n=1 Tax=Aquimarina penaris TaxID=3231044 RepID=UPI0034625542